MSITRTRTKIKRILYIGLQLFLGILVVEISTSLRFVNFLFIDILGDFIYEFQNFWPVISILLSFFTDLITLSKFKIYLLKINLILLYSLYLYFIWCFTLSDFYLLLLLPVIPRNTLVQSFDRQLIIEVPRKFSK